jgi:hypothetical protein
MDNTNGWKQFGLNSIFSPVPQQCYVLLPFSSHFWKKKKVNWSTWIVLRTTLNYVQDIFLKLFTLANAFRLFVSTRGKRCESSMQLAWIKPCSKQAGVRRAGIASRVSVGLSGRLLLPPTNYKVHLIHKLCVSRLPQIIWWPQLHDANLSCVWHFWTFGLHYRVAISCNTRLNANKILYKNWWLYIRHVWWMDCIETHISVQ